MNASFKLVLVLLTVSLVFAGCKDGGADKPKVAAERQYDVKGKVTALNPSKPAVTLDHEDIPGLMKAMEMEFNVQNVKLLEGIKVGDQVQGQLKKAESGYTITNLQKR
jgi:Cu/Ag efflux protein CusF